MAKCPKCHDPDSELETYEGAHLHHMTPSVAVYIPKELHRSICHNLKTGEGMKEINTKAMKWVEGFK